MITSMFSRRALASALGAAVLIAWTATGAQALDRPTDKPILTVTGKIGVTNRDGSAQFDRAMLEALGMVSFQTATPWHTGKVTFEGVPLRKLMDALGATGEQIVASALNDYSATLPIADLRRYNVILALKCDGEYMPVRDKGPLFIVYPYDSDAELRAEIFYARSVWQVVRMEIR